MIEWLIAIIFIEAVTEIIVSSSIFARFRKAVATKSDFLGELIHCGYCTSIWVAMSVAWAVPLILSGIFIVDYLIKIFVLHRISNILHEFIARWLGRVPLLSYHAHKTETVVMPYESTSPKDQN